MIAAAAGAAHTVGLLLQHNQIVAVVPPQPQPQLPLNSPPQPISLFPPLLLFLQPPPPLFPPPTPISPRFLFLSRLLFPPPPPPSSPPYLIMQWQLFPPPPPLISQPPFCRRRV